MPFGDNIEQTKEWASEGGKAKAAIYELDKLNEEKMRKALGKDLELVERVQSGTATEYELKIFPVVQARILKYVDKLHVSRTSTDITTKGESININPKTLEIAKKYEEELNKEEDKVV